MDDKKLLKITDQNGNVKEVEIVTYLTLHSIGNSFEDSP